MKTLKIFLLSLILILSLSTGVKAEFFTDVIVTSASGIWTDSRAYATLNAAITAVGANQRTIKIVSPQIVTNLTVPSNVTLDFERDGSITNSGLLTINTKSIRADNRQIFTGVGAIDFASGTIVKTGWFSNIETAFALTNNDTVTLIVSKPQTITASYSPGNDVNLRWESPGNILTVNAGLNVTNIGQIEAGNYQILAGAGHFHFRDGTKINLNWVPYLRTALTWIDATKVTLEVNDSSPVDYSDSIPSNIQIKVNKGGDLAITGGITLTLTNPKQIDIGPYYFDPFTGAGSVAITGGLTYTPATTLTAVVLGRQSTLSYEVDALYDYGSGTSFTQATITSALTAIGVVNKTTLLLRPGTWVISSNADWSAYTNVTFKIVPGAKLSGAFTVNIPNVEAGLYQIFDSTLGVVTFSGYVKESLPQWFYSGSGSYSTAIQAAITALSSIKGTVVNYPGTYSLTVGITLPYNDVSIEWKPGAVWDWAGANTGVVLNIRNPAATTVQFRNRLINPRITHTTTMINGSVAIGAYYLNGIHIEKPNIEKAYTGISLIASGDGKIEDFHFVDTAAGGTSIACLSVADFSIRRGTGQGAVGSQPAYGILVNEVSGALDISEVDFFQQGQGLRLEPPDTKVIMVVNVDKCRFDSGTYGIVLAGSATGLIWTVNVTNTWTANNTEDGVIIAGAATMDFSGIHFNNLTSGLNGKRGIFIAGPVSMEDISITNSTISGNSTSSHGTYSGIAIQPDIGNVRISGTKSGQITTLDGLSNAFQAYGIAISAGTGANIIVTENNLLGNTSGAYVSGASGANQVLQDNIGYKTKNFGLTGALSTGNTIAHGLAIAPNYASVTPVTGAAISAISVTSDATNITVTFTGTTCAFYWVAEYKP